MKPKQIPRFDLTTGFAPPGFWLERSHPRLSVPEERSHDNTNDETVIDFRVLAISWQSVVVPNKAGTAARSGPERAGTARQGVTRVLRRADLDIRLAAPD